MNKCPYCNTTYEEIKQTGFVGCSHCYSEIIGLKEAIKSMHKNKKHKGRKPSGGNV